MAKQTLLLLFILVILVSGMGVASSSDEVILGVHDGDSFSYVFSASWESNDPNAQPPEDVGVYQEIKYHNISIVQVSGGTIALSQVVVYKNGTIWSDETSASWNSYGLLFIPANLSEGDTILPTDYVINETITHTYVDSVRSVNHLSVLTVNGQFEFYWDKTSGVAIEQTVHYSNQTADYVTSWTVSREICDTNLWIVPEFPTFLMLPLFMIATLLAVILYRKKHSMRLY